MVYYLPFHIFRLEEIYVCPKKFKKVSFLYKVTPLNKDRGSYHTKDLENNCKSNGAQNTWGLTLQLLEKDKYTNKNNLKTDILHLVF